MLFLHYQTEELFVIQLLVYSLLWICCCVLIEESLGEGAKLCVYESRKEKQKKKSLRLQITSVVCVHLKVDYLRNSIRLIACTCVRWNGLMFSTQGESEWNENLGWTKQSYIIKHTQTKKSRIKPFRPHARSYKCFVVFIYSFKWVEFFPFFSSFQNSTSELT